MRSPDFGPVSHHIDTNSSEFKKEVKPKFPFVGGIGKARERRIRRHVDAHNLADTHVEITQDRVDMAAKAHGDKLLSEAEFFVLNSLDEALKRAKARESETVKNLPKSLRGPHK